MVELAVLEDAPLSVRHWPSGPMSPRDNSSLWSPTQSSRNSARPTRSGPTLRTGLHAATATRLRFQKRPNVPKFVPDHRSVDPPECAAHVQLSLPLQDLHTAPADCSINAFINPRPGNGRQAREINWLWTNAHTSNTSSAATRTNRSRSLSSQSLPSPQARQALRQSRDKQLSESAGLTAQSLRSL